jgi:hypothetical protein
MFHENQVALAASHCRVAFLTMMTDDLFSAKAAAKAANTRSLLF